MSWCFSQFKPQSVGHRPQGESHTDTGRQLLHIYCTRSAKAQGKQVISSSPMFIYKSFLGSLNRDAKQGRHSFIARLQTFTDQMADRPLRKGYVCSLEGEEIIKPALPERSRSAQLGANHSVQRWEAGV